MEVVLAVIAYGAIMAAIVLYARSGLDECSQDCDQGRNCDCKNGDYRDDEWTFK